MKYIATILAAAFSVSSAQSQTSLVEQFKATGGYSALVRTLEEDGGYFQEVVAGTGPMTFFGPSDVAFAVLGGPDRLDFPDSVTAILNVGRHTVVGVYTTEDIKAAGCLNLISIAGFPIRAMYVKDGDDGHIMINDAMVIQADIDDGTRIFHGLDKVFLKSDVTYDCSTEAITTTDAPVPLSLAFLSPCPLSLLPSPHLLSKQPVELFWC